VVPEERTAMLSLIPFLRVLNGLRNVNLLMGKYESDTGSNGPSPYLYNLVHILLYYPEALFNIIVIIMGIMDKMGL
jgi:hypothetical protein